MSNSAPHNLARAIEKILTLFLRIINTIHIKSPGDLILRIRNVNMTNRAMASLVLKYYTPIYPSPCPQNIENPPQKETKKLPLSVYKFFKNMQTNHCFFSFSNILYSQKFVLPMGSPISGILAHLFLNFLENAPFRHVMLKSSTCLRYMDNVPYYITNIQTN